jgi:hypothetical protein
MTVQRLAPQQDRVMMVVIADSARRRTQVGDRIVGVCTVFAASRCPARDHSAGRAERSAGGAVPLLAGWAVGELDHDVEVTEVAGVLLDKVEQDPLQGRRPRAVPAGTWLADSR